MATTTKKKKKKNDKYLATWREESYLFMLLIHI